MQRITYKLVKQWLSKSELAKELGFTLHCYSGYYYLTDNNTIDIVAKYPRELWEMWGIFKLGYYMGVNKN